MSDLQTESSVLRGPLYTEPTHTNYGSVGVSFNRLCKPEELALCDAALDSFINVTAQDKAYKILKINDATLTLQQIVSVENPYMIDGVMTKFDGYKPTSCMKNYQALIFGEQIYLQYHATCTFGVDKSKAEK